MLNYNIRQSPVNTVNVEIEEALDSTYKHGTLEVHIDPLFNPTHYARIYGKVVAVPNGNCYNEDGEEIEKEVKVGDKIYFHYLVTNDESNCVYGNYYKVPYYWIFCRVVGDDILPVGGWSLCSPIVEEENDFEKIEVNGKKISGILSSSGLVTALAKTPSVKYATLSYIGTPLKNTNKLEVNAGEKVILAKNSNFKNKIEGTDYYTVRQSDIMGKKCV
jgi:co-chaperonin GroES (HSP10)